MGAPRPARACSTSRERPRSSTRARSCSATTTSCYADELLRAITVDFLSLLLEAPLRNLTGLDVARLEIGTGSIGFHGEKELFENLRFLGDLEQTLRGRTYDLRGQLRLTDALSLEGEYLDREFIDEAEEDDNDLRLRIVYRYLIP